jgi:dTDP-4-amino-4,6-dideoxygalactose transaminase
MKSSQLALFGGNPAVPEALSGYVSMGDEEVAAVTAVMRSGTLSGFLGAWGDAFYGGPAVRALEEAWCRTFGCAHAVSVNSATTGLFAAIGAAGVGPGDEVIVPPYTMSATAMAPLMYGGIPVFVDIDEDTFCLDPALVRAAITAKTKAIVVVNVLGHPAPLHALRALADEFGIVLIEDNAQSPLATEGGAYAGTIGHIGVFSLNVHKHFHAGEGGVCVTDDTRLFERLAMIRNHGENVVAPLQIDDLTNLVGANYRMTEITAAIGSVQLRHAEEHVRTRVLLAEALSEGVRGLEGLTVPYVRPGSRHVYYCWALRIDEQRLGVSRKRFVEALVAEGFPMRAGFVAPLYLLPVFQRRVAIGSSGYPFTFTDRTYAEGLCPVTERIEEHEMMIFLNCAYDVRPHQIEQLVEAVRKVHAGIDQLRSSVADERAVVAAV